MAATDLQTVTLDTPYELTDAQVRRFREEGFIKLKDVMTPQLLQTHGCEITRLTHALNRNKDTPLDERGTYGKAFIQVSNLWEQGSSVRDFAFSTRLAGIATQLLGTRGVRMWHDQALYKEAGGGFTPWHADQQYWPMSSALSVTAWIPLQATPIDMGPLCFAKGSHLKNIGRDLAISDESERLIQQAIAEHGIIEVQEPFDLGEVSFHYGWSLHRAGPNTTGKPREVFTVIYMDQAMRLAEPKNKNQQNDWHVWTPATQIGQVMDDPKNPVLFMTDDDN